MEGGLLGIPYTKGLLAYTVSSRLARAIEQGSVLQKTYEIYILPLISNLCQRSFFIKKKKSSKFFVESLVAFLKFSQALLLPLPGPQLTGAT